MKVSAKVNHKINPIELTITIQSKEEYLYYSLLFNTTKEYLCLANSKFKELPDPDPTGLIASVLEETYYTSK